ncbi:type VI protein secretion system component VasK [Bacillus thermophilus]|uniref:Type VI protein secretion system component VasK n=1 Tax=Siminovitchia thermophila TaxID=1245522 RepID=A0ABS2RB52_9BACI|nr:type VI protein secretion system component VasK [Siminovitchia thermophila]ONK21335.1 hypothetical protein BLX87_22380 [Bacillus sp. VT-16-64]
MKKEKHSKYSRGTKLIIWIMLVLSVSMLVFFINNIVNDLYYQPVNYTSALGLALGVFLCIYALFALKSKK